jgi:two-component system chemotaxis sensor kinase CheA
MNELNEIVQEFLVESYENLDQLDSDLIALEQDPESRELLSSIFRTIHTIKGTSGFLAFSQLESIAHVGENLLSKLRDGALSLNPPITSALLEMVDAIRTILASVETTGEEGNVDNSALVARLSELQTAEADHDEYGDEFEEESDDEAPLLGELLIEHTGVDPDDITVAVMEQQLGDDRRLGDILIERGHATEDDVVLARAVQMSTKGEGATDQRTSVADSSIRVDVALLDTLMRLVGELVLTRNQIVAQSTATDSAMSSTSQRLSLLVSELQQGVMKTRMQPIDTVWGKLPRVVRDLGVSCGRSVRLVMEGRETELDKSILEAVKDPLTHLVRNAVDHGIEPPEVRAAAGKAEEGTIILRAYHEGGQVNIEIVDDGAGIDPQRVAAKAVERGVISREQASLMSPRELTNLIFLPGFSTAAKVTNVSGRGVGMDVVRTNIEKIGGMVDVVSEPCVGSTFRIKIPLTLAIIPALTVECQGEMFALPQVNVLELVCLDGEAARTGIEMLSGAPVHRLRGRLLPLVRLDEALGVSRSRGAEPDGSVFIVVLQADGQQFGLVVDQVLNTQEIVVKPLGQQIKGVGVYAGATILGDGRVALILDVRAFARLVHAVRETDTVEAAAARTLADHAIVTEDRLLVVGLGSAGQGDERRVAIPLEMVTRLEDIPTASVESVGDQLVVQYRDRVLPLVRLGCFLGGPVTPIGDSLKVIVYDRDGRRIGLVVDSILDIAARSTEIRSDVVAHGLLGSAVIDGRVTELLDVHSAILSVDARFFSDNLAEAGA